MGFGLFTDASRGQSTTCNPSRNTEPRLFVSTIISTQELLAEQQRFSAEVGAEIKKAYQRECVFNVDETAVYYEEDPASSFSSAAEASPRGSKDAAVRIERCAAHRFRGRKKTKAASHFPRSHSQAAQLSVK
ncbi:hypothetical protein DVH05_006737 [Phytophthora capsici]|nr:hypothetical protein DVH05_006737 [Phytophthora capsici]